METSICSITNGATFSTLKNQSGPGNVFYEQIETGHFQDISTSTNTAHAGWGTGIAIGDVDNNGLRDLYVSNYGANVLYYNKGENIFVDGTSQARVGGDQFSASAAFFDYDNDGDLDLYATNYVVFDAENRPALSQTLHFLWRFTGLLWSQGAYWST